MIHFRAWVLGRKDGMDGHGWMQPFSNEIGANIAAEYHNNTVDSEDGLTEEEKEACKLVVKEVEVREVGQESSEFADIWLLAPNCARGNPDEYSRWIKEIQENNEVVWPLPDFSLRGVKHVAGCVVRERDPMVRGFHLAIINVGETFPSSFTPSPIPEEMNEED